MSAVNAVQRSSDACDLAPGYIRAIAPYQPGKPISELAREFNLDPDSIIKLASLIMLSGSRLNSRASSLIGLPG